ENPINILTNQPLRTILQKPNLSGRLLKWSVELGKFDITYLPRPAIKSQVLADFVTELAPQALGSAPTPGFELKDIKWSLFMDGSSNKMGSGAGVVLNRPNDVTIESALRFEFPATNNEAEYKAMILGLQLAKNMGIKSLRVVSDSQLVVGQIRGEFEVKDEAMTLYLLKVRGLIMHFETCLVEKIPRSQNKQADILSKLVSM